ncbi:protein cmss1 [Plakobranchus ocellatus]|uniref:Protein cmss1 n=1 Tax=Plakobranchus ocellatus TaxID=259542 RepID=A0AAV3XZQ6_9GAST|nr:protein cmss1 [Plakobranchus ocellatus]
MADALDDEWWLENENETSAKSNDDTAQLKTSKDGKLKDKAVVSNKPKRKAEATDINGKDMLQAKKKKRSNSKSGQVQHKQRKRITEESEETLSKPAAADDVRTMMSKVLQERLGKEALEDVLPSDDDFYPHNVEALVPSKYLAKILTNWRATLKKSLFMKKTGSPCILIVTSSAIRAVELNRLIKDFLDGKCKVAKLFAKHMKVKEQKKYLSQTNCQVGIGTPGRLLLLIKQGALQLESLTAVVLDWNWRDAKLKRLPDIPEVRQDLVQLLKDFLLETVRGSPCKLALL